MTTHERIGEQRKVDKRGEHDIKFAEPCQDAAEYPLDSTALIVQLPVVFAVLSAILFRREHGVAIQLAHVAVLKGTIHNDIPGRPTELTL